MQLAQGLGCHLGAEPLAKNLEQPRRQGRRARRLTVPPAPASQAGRYGFERGNEVFNFNFAETDDDALCPVWFHRHG